MRRLTVLMLLVLGLLSATAQRPATPSSLPTPETVNAFMRRMFGFDPSVTWQIVEIKQSIVPNMAEIVVRVGDQPTATRLYVTPDGRYVVMGDVLPFGADPFAPVREQLARRATGPARGPANARVTIATFSDLQCPHCRQAHPMLDRLLTDHPNVRLVFQQFPLTAIHKWAFRAAAVGECVATESQPAFWKYAQTVYDHQDEITEANADAKLTAYAVAAGVDGHAVAACASSSQIAARINDSLELGRSLGVTGTPTVFINGRKVTQMNAIPYERLNALVTFEELQGK